MPENVLQQYSESKFQESFGDLSAERDYLNSALDEPLEEELPEAYHKPVSVGARIMGFGDGMYHGFQDAAAAMSNLVVEGLFAATGVEPFEEKDITRASGVFPERAPEEPTITGKIARGIGQTAGSLAVGGAITKVTGIAKAAEGGAFAEKAMPWISAFVGDFVGFEAQQKNLTELLNDTELKDNAVVKAMNAFFAKDENDSEVMGRLKNTLELEFVGAGATAIFKAAKFMKNGIMATDLTKVASTKIQSGVKAANKSKKQIQTMQEKKGAELNAVVKKITKDVDVTKETKPIQQQIEESSKLIKEELGVAIESLPPELKKEALSKAKGISKEAGKRQTAATIIQAKTYDDIMPGVTDSWESFLATGDSYALKNAADGISSILEQDRVVADIFQEPARALGVRSGSKVVQDVNALNSMLDSGDVKNIEDFVRAGVELSDPSKRSVYLKGLDKLLANKKLAYDNLVFLRQNAFLSGAEGLGNDIFSTSLFNLYTGVPEKAVGATIGMIRKGTLGALNIKTSQEAVQFGEAAALINSIGNSAFDGIRLMKTYATDIINGESAKSVFNRIGADATKYARSQGDQFGGDAAPIFTTPASLGLDPNTPFATMIDFLNKGSAFFPVNIRRKVDQVGTGVIKRADLNSRALRQASFEGLTGDAKVARIKQIKDNAEISFGIENDNDFINKINALGIDQQQAKVDRGLANQSLKTAQQRMFTDESGIVAEKVQKLLDVTPGGRIIVPFFKTTTKILFDRFLKERTPAAIFNPEFLKQVLKGGAESDMAIGQLSLGTGLMVWAYDQATKGNILGKLPDNEGDRNLLLANGFIENSIRVGDEFIDISTKTPIANFLLFPANMQNLYRENEDTIGEEEDKQISDALMVTTLGMIDLFKDQSAMRGLSELMDAISSKRPDKFKRILSNITATTLVPGIVKQVIKQEEKQFADGVLEAIKVRAGGKTRPALNVYGNPMAAEDKWLGVIPAKQSNFKHDDVSSEASRVGASIKKPGFTLKGVRIEPLERYRLIEIMGEIGVHKTMEDLINKRFYHNLPEEEKSGNFGAQNQTKKGVLELTFNTIKRVAGERLIEETPDLKQRIQQSNYNAITLSAEKPLSQTIMQNFQ